MQEADPVTRPLQNHLPLFTHFTTQEALWMLQYLLQHVRAFNSTSTASVNGGMTNKSILLIYTRMVCTDAINNLGSTDGVQEAGRLGACGQQRTCMPTLAAPLGQWAPPHHQRPLQSPAALEVIQ